MSSINSDNPRLSHKSIGGDKRFLSYEQTIVQLWRDKLANKISEALIA